MRERTAERRPTDLQELLVLALVPAAVGVLILAGWALRHWHAVPVWVGNGLALTATLFGGWTRFAAGFRDAAARRITVNVFVAVALTATLAVGEFLAAAVIVFIMSVSGALETYTLDRNRRSIRDLLDLAPATARVRRNGREEEVPLDRLEHGDILVVRPGERIPVDGVVEEGASSVDQAPITGESMPVEKFPGNRVFSGTLNRSGVLMVRATRVGDETTLARIVHLVEEAQKTRAPIQNLADRFTAWFLPAVSLLAVIGYVNSGDVKVAVSILLVACPCAFAIATPTAVTAGISNLARRSVLVKGGIFLELGGRLRTLLVDKTGTFTLGRPAVEEVLPLDGADADQVLCLAASAEKYSEHPLARAVLDRCRERGLPLVDPQAFRVEPGRGVTARWNGAEVLVGSPAFLEARGAPLPEKAASLVREREEAGKTVILVARDRRPVGLLALADQVRPETARAVARIRDMGVRRIAMLTGDHPRVAQGVGRRIGVDEVRAGLLPEEKQAVVREFQARGERVGMIGDGINDAPALALADVGIAMGRGGTDVAVDTADVTLMNDDLERVADFLWMSRKVLRRIKLNIFFSMVYNVIGLTLGSLAMLTPVLAVLFQEAGCVSVVASSTLLLWARPPHERPAATGPARRSP